MLTVRAKDVIVNDFHSTVQKLEIGRLDAIKRRLRIISALGGRDVIVSLALPVLHKYNARIAEPDPVTRDAYIADLNVVQECAAAGMDVNGDHEYIIRLIESTRAHYIAAKIDERNAVVAQVLLLSACAAEYKLGGYD